jgi:hypothetical protein
MSEIEQFSGLISDVYDAALDPALWPGVFVEACNFVGASAATLASHDMVKRGTSVFYNWGLARCDKLHRGTNSVAVKGPQLELAIQYSF